MSTPNQPPDLDRRLQKLEADVARYAGRLDSPGYQMLNGVPYFPGGIQIGGGARSPIFEPYEVPPALSASASWGSSFDVIYIDVQWAQPVGYGAEIVSGYTIQAFKEGSTIPIEVSALGPNTTKARIQPVEPHTTYMIRVYAHTKTDRMAAPATVTITTGADTSAPGAVSFPGTPISVGLQSLAVKWNANTERDVANGAGQYRVIVSVNSDLSSPVRDFRQAGTQAFITGLVPNTLYFVGVAAVDSSGNQGPLTQPSGGPWSPLAIVTTDIALAVGGGNIVKNSSFEAASLAHWSATSGTWTADPTVGTRFGVLAAGTSGTSDAFLHQDVTLYTGTWVISTWAKALNVARAPGSTAEGIVLNWQLLSGTQDGPGVVLMGGTDDNGGRVVAGRGSFEWKRLAFRIKITSTAVMRIFLQRGYGGQCTGQAWFDGVQAEQGDTITAYAPRPDEILPNTITAVEIANDAVTAPKIIAGAIVAGKIAANAVGTNELAARSITAGKIAVDAITANEIAAGAITASELSVNAVTADKIAANSITTSKLAADTITADKLAVTMGVSVGKVIQSANYVGGSSGWRIGGEGSAEFQNAVIRGSTWGGGSINIANRLVASVADPTVHLAANVEMGANYSGTIFSGDINWGFQIGNNGLGAAWTHLRAALVPGSDYYIAMFDMYRNRRIVYVDTAANFYHPGPDGSVYAEKVAQQGDWGTKALIVRNSSAAMNEGNLDHAGIGFHVRQWNIATILQCVGPVGEGLEVRTGNNVGYAPLRASAFLVSSAAETKTEIEDLPAEQSRVAALRPVTFKRPAGTCSICHGTGKVVAPEPDNTAELPLNEEGVGPEPPMLPVGSKCPHHSGEKKWKRSKAQEKYEDSKFVGLVAEEVAEVYPEVVGWRQTDSGPVPDSIDYAGLVALAISEIQRLSGRLDALETKEPTP